MAGAVTLLAAAPAGAVNTVTTANGANWQIHDAAPPILDSGSIRAITDNAFYGFGGIRVNVAGIPASDPTGRLNGELMRGFGLTYDGDESFATTTPVGLGGVAISRTIKVSKPGNWTRWLDTFANTTGRAVTVDVTFGGSAGQNSGSNQSRVTGTSSGDTAIDNTDRWVAINSPNASGMSTRGPSAVVIGSTTGTSNFQRDPFGAPLPTSGLEANFYGYRNTLTLAPGETESLLRFVVAGRTETAQTSGAQTATVTTAATGLAGAPDLAGLSASALCTVTNFQLAQDCATTPVPPLPTLPEAKPKTTSAGYDVVDKSITQLVADMESGLTTSQEITRAYLDRIEAYDKGQFGFHAFITVAKDAMEQAAAADAKRAAGVKGDLLGVPVVIKDLYDTKDMPTTDGSLAFEGWQPKRDAFQVAKLREAGAIILGKGNMSEFANSGSYSESGYGMVWNAFKPSKTSLGSSGGSAVAVATSMAAFGMGSQTGVSLYAPSTGASLVTLRGTDGIASGAGVMPLTWLQDFAGPMARTTSDIARILNATTGTDPDDLFTLHNNAGAKRPADYKTALDANALKGKRIGYLPAAFTGSPSYGQSDGTMEAVTARFADIQAAGATMVELTTNPPSGPATGTLTGNRTEEGWQQYFDLHENPPYTTASGILSSPKVLPYNRQTVPVRPRMTAEDIQKVLTARDGYKDRIKAWMDENNVDAVVYPGFRSDVYDNDGAQTLSSDRNSGVLTSNVGLPTLVLPVGANPHGDPISIQFVGRAFDDAKMLGFGYALERQLGGAGHIAPTTAPRLTFAKDTTGTVGGTVPATLNLTLGEPAKFQPFIPGVEQEYTASTTAGVISTAGEATLTVSEPGHLANGPFSLAEPLRVETTPASWTGPVSNASVDITFKQLIKRTDPLRTGTYSKTLTFTLSTTTP
ncbi:amidase [Solirubrobacter sp. CPCC 204708]|nr:amidase [Solirubrobacter deserti]